jgi:hypothetical protein
MKVKLIGAVALAAVGLAFLWKFMSEPAGLPQSSTEPVAVSPPRVGARENSPDAALRSPSKSVVEPTALNERTLVGTKWEREGFGLEFSADGKLLIGGRERARWRVEGSRIRLYRDTTGEEHWLDIVGDKLMWKGKEIARVP